MNQEASWDSKQTDLFPSPEIPSGFPPMKDEFLCGGVHRPLQGAEPGGQSHAAAQVTFLPKEAVASMQAHPRGRWGVGQNRV